ncbi:MAG: pentapeptide repeat-containing protein [Methylocella sp.]
MLVYAVLVVTFPDERMYLATKRWHGSPYQGSPVAVISPVNTLFLRGDDLIDDAKLAHIIAKNESATGENRWEATLVLRDRDLTGADLSDADLRHVDFSSAILNRAYLARAWATKAHFDHAQLQGVSLDKA